jgi:hypothetical protein
MEQIPEDLEPIADQLRRLRPEASRSELDRIKARALSRASMPGARPSARRRRIGQKRLLWVSARAASLTMMIILFGGATVVLATKKGDGGLFSGGSSSGSASNTQYCPPGSQQPGKKQDPRPENCGVALTPGYWKNHQRHTELLLPVTLGSFTVTDFSTVTAVFNGMNCGSSTAQSAVGCLAGHLLASTLNVKNQASNCIQPTIDQANAFLQSIGYTGPSGTYTLTAEQRALAIQLKDKLDKYNNTGNC